LNIFVSIVFFHESYFASQQAWIKEVWYTV